MTPRFGPRRGIWLEQTPGSEPLAAETAQAFDQLDATYRTLCAMLYNYAPMSGHPGGSISSGRIVAALLFDTMEYDLANPDRDDADVISYAAGHKALGLYSMWALRNEIARIGQPALLGTTRDQFRLEDLLGFRRNPRTSTPLFKAFASRPLDGHPTPATPFVKLATGASGVGICASLGYALALRDWYGSKAPRVHIVEGEGGLTPGRVVEALAFAGTAALSNAIVHVDWNQSSIDSDRVTRESGTRGDYVQWDPMELFHLHDWNVVYVPDGLDMRQVISAQRGAMEIDNGQPTAIVYRTKKGWRYGVEGKASHGAGHKLCSAGFFDALALPEGARSEVPRCEVDNSSCKGGADSETVELCYWQALSTVRRQMEADVETAAQLSARLASARQRLDERERKPRDSAPSIGDVHALTAVATLPPELELRPGVSTTLRAQLGKALGVLNRYSGGAFFIAAADLLGSTSINEAGKDFASGFYACGTNEDTRTLSIGGICEDAMSGVLAGISSFGKHVGVGASYGAFLAPLGHIASRLHAIGNQARKERGAAAGQPMILICGHAGLKTGEDGPTH
ncbi:MAG: hypothetical protein ACXW2P_11160, partial [Thermoanaerobaculia bacterium]